MPKPSSRLASALAAVGARLKRDKKHRVYVLPNGRTFVTGSTPSDCKSDLNAISDLRAAAGVEFPERRKASTEVRAERRARPGRADSSLWSAPLRGPQLAVGLRDTGIIEQQLRGQITSLESRVVDLEATVADRDEQIAMLERLWVVRAWKAIRW